MSVRPKALLPLAWCYVLKRQRPEGGCVARGPADECLKVECESEGGYSSLAITLISLSSSARMTLAS